MTVRCKTAEAKLNAKVLWQSEVNYTIRLPLTVWLLRVSEEEAENHYAALRRGAGAAAAERERNVSHTLPADDFWETICQRISHNY
jgi:hypothetical protein